MILYVYKKNNKKEKKKQNKTQRAWIFAAP